MHFYSLYLSDFFKINFCVLAEEIMAAKIEVINLFTVLESQIFVGEQSALYV